MAIKISPQEFPKELKKRLRNYPKVIARGARLGAKEGARILKNRTPSNLGTTASRWEVNNRGGSSKRGVRMPSIENRVPHVGILETGARPHPVNAEGIAALSEWARLKLGLSFEEADNAAHAIAWKIRKKGQEPTYFVLRSIPDLVAAMHRGMAKATRDYAKKKAKKGGK
jgi:hypothetical protein